MNRRHFFLAVLQSLCISAGALALKACGGSSGDYSGGGGIPQKPTPNCLASGTTVSIEVVHTPNHTLDIPQSDLLAGAPKTYTLEDNGSAHTHSVTLTADDFLSLQNNQSITKLSSSNLGHTHNVTVQCI